MARELIVEARSVMRAVPAAPMDGTGRNYIAAHKNMVQPISRPYRSLLELARTGMPDDEIAEILTREGHHSPNCEDKVLPITVQRLRLAAGIKAVAQRNRWTHEPTLLNAVQLAARLDIPVNWIYVQIRRKRLLIDQQSTGAYLFQNSPAVVNAVRDLRNRTIHHLDLRIIQPHQEGHQHA